MTDVLLMDTTPTGELVTGPALPCTQCGRPTPFRVGGQPRHGGGFCAPAAPAPATPAAAPAPRRAPARPATRPARPARTARPAPASEPEPTRYPAGPLAVLDAAKTGLTAHLTDGRTVPVAAKTLPDVAEWALEAGLGAARLHQHGRDADPLVVLTDAACKRLGLPAPGATKAAYDMQAGRLPETHKAVKAITDAGWQLTRRGLGAWARLYRTPDGARRQCVQLCVPLWGALSDRGGWRAPEGLAPGELARLLGAYASRVITPCGSTAVTGLELMTALRPPTRAVRTGSTWSSGLVEGSLHHAVQAAPPEVPAEHPAAKGRTGPALDEEAWAWTRPATAEEAGLPFAVGIDVNVMFLAAANRLSVGLGEPVHTDGPAFDKRIPGSWLVDLSGVETDPRLPSPFTPDGQRPTGPGWYTTATVAYAEELGARVQPIEAWLRPEHGPYLTPWYTRLRDAYMATMAALGITPELADDPAAFTAAMATLKASGDRAELAVLAAIKATAKGALGKLRERPSHPGYRPGQPWPALERPTWRPDIRAAVIATARVGLHRKLAKTAAATGAYPLAVATDCVVYPAPSPDPLSVLPYTPDGTPMLSATGRPVAGLRLGVSPGHAKVEGIRPLPEVLAELADGTNPARHMKAAAPGSE